MEIIIKDAEFIQKSVDVKDVFKPETLGVMYTAIRNDFEDDILEGWSGTTPEELGYDWTTSIGSLKLQKQAIEYAIYASELSLFDFLQEFSSYTNKYYYEYEDFMEEVASGEIKVVASKFLL